MELDGEERATVQLVKRLLKILGRCYGVRVKGIAAVRL